MQILDQNANWNVWPITLTLVLEPDKIFIGNSGITLFALDLLRHTILEDPSDTWGSHRGEMWFQEYEKVISKTKNQ